uniref:Ig-like domain-containing protein n=1 Tax=Taeniopygia guttata TaxID=59729 RepID=A0A674GR73_TAEGU
MSPNVPKPPPKPPPSSSQFLPVPPSSSQFLPVPPSSSQSVQFVPVRPSSSQFAMLPLLLAALGAPGAAPFVLQVASSCWLATDGSLVATNGSQDVEVALSRMPLVCGDLRGPRGGPCQQGGLLGTLGDTVAQALAQDSRWGQRLRQRRRLCQELPKMVWPPLRAPPRLRIVPERWGTALALTCYAWAFSPADITLTWLRNGVVPDATTGDIIGDIIGGTVGDTSRQSRALPVGDGTFRAQVTIQVPPGTSGDTFECLALHPGLEEPLRVTWAPGPSRRLSLLVAFSVLSLLLGLLLLLLGLRRFLRPGYSPLPGATHAGEEPLFSYFLSLFYHFLLLFVNFCPFPSLFVPFLPPFFLLFSHISPPLFHQRLSLFIGFLNLFLSLFSPFFSFFLPFYFVYHFCPFFLHFLNFFSLSGFFSLFPHRFTFSPFLLLFSPFFTFFFHFFITIYPFLSLFIAFFLLFSPFFRIFSPFLFSCCFFLPFFSFFISFLSIFVHFYPIFSLQVTPPSLVTPTQVRDPNVTSCPFFPLFFPIFSPFFSHFLYFPFPGSI